MFERSTIALRWVCRIRVSTVVVAKTDSQKKQRADQLPGRPFKLGRWVPGLLHGRAVVTPGRESGLERVLVARLDGLEGFGEVAVLLLVLGLVAVVVLF